MTRIKAVSSALIVGQLQSLCLLTYPAYKHPMFIPTSHVQDRRTARGSWGRWPGQPHKPTRLSNFDNFFVTRFKRFGKLSDDMF
ncbi:hypothetical protein JVT61DRAFT_12556 [Boletus reticuloceps]|uniref:Secreted protein n=1 Tax=Boletus reticuloceps TaxID=495285 RepID=A0A8I3A3D9_9AGAM|nr:hypothetical protein JVT61DRAFT_12556 [Boletus reticuloceps]